MTVQINRVPCPVCEAPMKICRLTIIGDTAQGIAECRHCGAVRPLVTVERDGVQVLVAAATPGARDARRS